MNATNPLPTASNSVSERAGDRVLEWLERHQDIAIVGPLFAYARAHTSHLVRFALIGASLAALNLSFLYCLRAWLHLSDPTAVTTMYILGVLAHFPAHRWITYRAQHQPMRPQGLRYAIMLVWNFVIMQTVVGLASRASISPYIAVMSSTGLTMISNFLVMTHIVFERKRRE
jgi:putative flippase GtrA